MNCDFIKNSTERRKRAAQTALVLLVALLFGNGPLAHSVGAADENGITVTWSGPATNRIETLPIGNRTVWALLFGGVPDERIQFGREPERSPQSRARNTEQFPADLFRSGAQSREPSDLRARLESLLADPAYQSTHQPVGELQIRFQNQPRTQEYRRSLDLATGIATTEYRVDEISYRCVAFAESEGLIVLQLDTDHRGGLNFTLGFDTTTNFQTHVVATNSIELFGARADSSSARRNLAVRVKVFATEGAAHSGDGKIIVRDAHSALILLALATEAETTTANELPTLLDHCETMLDRASRQIYEQLRAKHLIEYRDALRLTNGIPAGAER